ncbi:MAG: hypothetical protein M3379_16405, partial [Acidobacteriota bacterium]|nr:hypothetical protein [Acidobacteriota bacterium]
MTASKPQFNLSRVKDTEADSAPALIPVATFTFTPFDRREFLCAGVSAAVALLFLSGCGHPEAKQVAAPFSPLQAHNTGGGIIMAIDDYGNLNSVGPDGVLKSWTLSNGELLTTSKGRPIGSSNCMTATTPDGKLRVRIPTDGHTIEIRDASDDSLVATLTGHTAPISCLVITRDGKLLVSADQNGTIIVWDLDPPGFRSFLFDPAVNRPEVKGIRYTAYNRTTGQSYTATLPCGAPIPPGAVCTCNCVPGTYTVSLPPLSVPTPTPYHPPPPPRHRHSGGGSRHGSA